MIAYIFFASFRTEMSGQGKIDPELLIQHDIEKIIYHYGGYIDRNSDNNPGKYHAQLFNAAKNGDKEIFFYYIMYSTRHDLEWCAEVASHIDIIHFIVEVRGITSFLYGAYKKALLENNNEIILYIERIKRSSMADSLYNDIADMEREGKKNDQQYQILKKKYDQLMIY